MENRILHISKYYYPYAGGVEDVCYNIVNTLYEKGGYDQQVLCFNDVNQTVHDTYEGVAITRVAIQRIVKSQPISKGYSVALQQILKSFKPDVVHFHAPNPFAAYYLLKLLPGNIKLIIHWHSDIVAQKLIYLLIRPIESRLLHRADTIIATSPNYIEYSKPLQKYRDKVIVLQNIIVPSKFHLTNERQLQIEKIKAQYQNKPIVLFVGRHVEYKGLQFLIEATHYIKSDCVILVGGKGLLTRQLKAQNSSNKVYFLGRIDDNSLAAYYNAAEIFAFPSITKNEAFGVSLAEAMYCQTPTITFTIKGSGVNWVSVDGQTGIEVENSDAKALAQAIDCLMDNNDLRHKFAIQARQRVEELFVIDRIREKILQLYDFASSEDEPCGVGDAAGGVCRRRRVTRTQ